MRQQYPPPPSYPESMSHYTIRCITETYIPEGEGGWYAAVALMYYCYICFIYIFLLLSDNNRSLRSLGSGLHRLMLLS